MGVGRKLNGGKPVGLSQEFNERKAKTKIILSILSQMMSRQLLERPPLFFFP